MFEKPASLLSAAQRCLPQKGTFKVDPDPSLDADVILVASALALAVAWGVRGVHVDSTPLSWPSSPGGVVAAKAVPPSHSCTPAREGGDVFSAQSSLCDCPSPQ